MTTHIIKSGVVVNTIVATLAEAQGAFPDATCIEATTGGIGWLWDGSTLSAPPLPVKSVEELQAEIIAATQARLDAFAATRNYDGILSACTYAASSIPQFSAEGQAAVNARDATWATLYTVLGEVQTGVRPVPTGFADIEADLPVLEWPV